MLARNENAALDRPGAKGYPRYPGVQSAVSATSWNERFIVTNGEIGDAPVPFDAQYAPNRSGKPDPWKGLAGYPKVPGSQNGPHGAPSWNGYSACDVGSEGRTVCWRCGVAVVPDSREDQRRRSQVVPAGTWISNWLREKDASTIVLLAAVFLSVTSLISSMIMYIVAGR